MSVDGPVLVGQVVGGRANGNLLLLPAGPGWPATWCAGVPGLGEHYVHEAIEPGLYVFAGSCREYGCSPLSGTPNG